ncbi:MAG: FecR domain-containing protein [Burkholderiales bacterium]|nr:FecR domain-containing protein [Burkholderiales bacterium]
MNANVVPLRGEPDAAEVARRWIIRIDAGPLNADERAALRAWLAADPTHAHLLDEHALLWAAAERASFAKPAPAPGPRPARRLAWRAWGAGLAIALVAGVALQLANAPSSSASAPRTFITAIGQQSEVALPDGSRMRLNTDTVARVEFDRQRRHVVIEKGEGLFEVAKDPSRPFEVDAGSTTARAVGTRFIVRRKRGDQADVTVFEGTVEVRRQSRPDGRSATGPVRVARGQAAQSAPEVLLAEVVAPESLARREAWRDGRIVFAETPLAEAVEEVNRYSPVPLVLDDPAQRPARISGAFATRDVEVFLRSLEQGFGLRVQRQADRIVITRGA